jgi:hypothetical protein
MHGAQLPGHSSSVTRRFIAAMTLSCLAGVAQAQQESDPEFNPSVARPAYTSEHPRVAVDEAHHNFHTIEGRYRPFAQLLASDGYKVASSTAAFDASTLSGIDVLVIANAMGGNSRADAASSAFSKSECDAVENWVRAGGALLLIADHTPFGGAAYDLAIRFGVDMGRGYVFDPQHADGNPTFLVFSADNGLLGDHPVLRGNSESEHIRRVVAFTGQSLSIPNGATVLMKLAPSAFEVDNPATGMAIVASARGGGGAANAPDPRTRSDAGRAQGLALTIDRGRVIVLGEAALFSAQVLKSQGPGRTDVRFGMNAPGNDDKQFVLNILHWLSGNLR